jgi:hypothetical protein
MKVKTNRGGNKETKCDVDGKNLNRRGGRKIPEIVFEWRRKATRPSQYNITEG